MELEFIDESSDRMDGAGDSGSARRPPRWAVPATLAVIALAVLVVLRHPDNSVTGSATPTAIPSDPVHVRPLQLSDPVEATMMSLQGEPDPLTDVVRPGGSGPSTCAQVRLGTSPQAQVRHAIMASFGRISRFESSRVIDQFASLCSLQVKAFTSKYLVVVMITSPDTDQPPLPAEYIQISSDDISAGVVAYARVQTVDGWTVVAGTIGRQRASDEDLLALAHDSAMRW